MKKIIISSGMLISNLIFSQVGINTPSPQGTFHVDGAKDNVSTGVPTAAQQSNDFVVLSNGNVGVGTVNPANKLEIRSATSGAIKIVDGTQADGAIFTSDANGVGSWKITAVTKSTVSGTFPTAGTNVLSGGGTTPKYSNVSITLTPGKWIVNAGMTMYNRSEIIEKSRVWLHAYLSSSVTSIQRNGFTLSGPSGNNTSYAGVLTKGNGSSSGNDNDLNFLSGSSIIEVTAASVTLYLLIEDKPVNTWEFNPRAWENYFYAIPIN